MTAFLTRAATALILAALTFFALQAGTVAMTTRFNPQNLHLDANQTPD